MPTIPEGEVTLSTLILALAVVLVKILGEFTSRRWPKPNGGGDAAAVKALGDKLNAKLDELLVLARAVKEQAGAKNELRRDHYEETKRIGRRVEKLRRTPWEPEE